jgi:dihydrodipicolinate synthase/N-acetylneuraminate lyase
VTKSVMRYRRLSPAELSDSNLVTLRGCQEILSNYLLCGRHISRVITVITAPEEKLQTTRSFKSRWLACEKHFQLKLQEALELAKSNDNFSVEDMDNVSDPASEQSAHIIEPPPSPDSPIAL